MQAHMTTSAPSTRTVHTHLNLVPSQVVELDVLVELDAGAVPEQVRKIHDPLIDLDDASILPCVNQMAIRRQPRASPCNEQLPPGRFCEFEILICF